MDMAIGGIALLRAPELRARLGIGHTTVFRWVRMGVIPPPIKLGPRRVAWVLSEIDQIISARISGQSEEDIRGLVARLVAQRGR